MEKVPIMEKVAKVEQKPKVVKVPKLSHSLVEMAEKVKRQLTRHLKLRNRNPDKNTNDSLPLGCYVNEEIKATRSQAQKVNDEEGHFVCEFPPSLHAVKLLFLGGGFPVSERIFDTSITVIVVYQIFRFFRQLIRQVS